LSIITMARSGLLMLGVHFTKRTEPSDVLGLIQKLRPKDWGGDMIRLGGMGDGGYVIPDDLEGVEYCFSPGVSTTSSFENDLADLKIKSFLADYSVDSPPVTRPELVFDKKFLGSSDRGHYMTLASWKDRYLKDYEGDMILQMDIEGCEYEVILNTPDHLLNQFRIIVMEFHELDRLFDPLCFRIISASFEKLLEYFDVVHIHPNNGCVHSVRTGDVEVPKVLEFTFLNKRRVKSTKAQSVFPHKLDTDNFPDLPPFHLPKCWVSSTT
jgi:hypothetical protein